MIDAPPASSREDAQQVPGPSEQGMLSDCVFEICIALPLLMWWMLDGAKLCKYARTSLCKAAVHFGADTAAAGFLHDPCTEHVI